MSDELKPCPPVVHRLKVWPQFIPSLEDGSKTFEARQDDRAFRVGDVLELYGWDPDTRTETGWTQRRTVTYKLSGPAWGVRSGHCAWGVQSGHCILGLSPLPTRATPAPAPADEPTNVPTARCPWCRVADVAVESMQCADRVVTGVDEDNGPVYWAECQRCGAQGPIVGWAADAIPEWNECAAPDPADDHGARWHCDHCGQDELAEPPYEFGDHEPCDCGKGVSRVMTLKQAAAMEQLRALGWTPPNHYTEQQAPAPVTVSDEMVEAALHAYHGIEWPHAFDEWEANLSREEMRAALSAALESARGAGDGWVACSERMPEEGQAVLVARPTPWGTKVEHATNQHGAFRGTSCWWHDGKYITHWRPLPPPPTDKAREE